MIGVQGVPHWRRRSHTSSPSSRTPTGMPASKIQRAAVIWDWVSEILYWRIGRGPMASSWERSDNGVLAEVDDEEHLIVAGLGLRLVGDEPVVHLDAPGGQGPFKAGSFHPSDVRVYQEDKRPTAVVQVIVESLQFVCRQGVA